MSGEPEHRQLDLDEVARLLDEAGDAASRFEVDTRLDAELPNMHRLPRDEAVEQDPVLGAVAQAFGYRIEETRQGSSRRIQFAPYFRGTEGHESPPPLTSVTREVIQIWAALASRVQAPYAKARLNHLLFACGHGNGRQHAEAAIAAYLQSAAQWHRDVDSVHDLNVALRLARAVGADDLASNVMMVMVDYARDALGSDTPLPGVTLRLLDPLTDELQPPSEVDVLLAHAWEAYPGPFTRDEVVELQLRRAISSQTRTALEEKRVMLWLEAAERAEGLVRAGHLKKALECATATGRRNLIERAAAELQEIQPDELGLVAIFAETALDEEQVDRLLQPITSTGSWQEALTRYGVYGPVTGGSAQNRLQVQADAREFVFSNLMPRESIGGDGLPRFRVETDDEKLEWDLSALEGQHLQVWGNLLARALTAIARRHGIPSEQDLADFFAERPLVDRALAEAIARVLVRFWSGDPEGAVFTVVPRIESLARTIVIATGAGIYRLQRQRTPGQYPGLGVLLDHLKQRGLDESWFRFLYTLCANPAGWNLRNEISHGFVHNAGAPIAALLIQALLYLTWLAPAEVVEKDDSETDDPGAATPDDSGGDNASGSAQVAGGR